MADVFVERALDPPVRREANEVPPQLLWRPPAFRAPACLALYRVRLMECLVADDGRRMLCRFAAPDAESVRVALRQAGIAFDAVWLAHRV